MHLTLSLLISVFALGQLPVAHALGTQEGEQSCEKAFAILYQETRRGKFLSDADAMAVEAIEKGSAPAAEKARLIFQRVLEARLSFTEPEVAAHVRATLAKIRVGSGRNVDGNYNPIFRKAGVSLPPYLFESAVEYMVKIHELEHALQHKTLSNRGHIFGLPFTKQRLLAESDAISLEWQYLRRVPVEVRAEIREKLLADTEMNGTIRGWVVAALESADEPFQTYIQRQRALGRYSKWSTGADNRAMAVILGIGVTYFTYRTLVAE